MCWEKRSTTEGWKDAAIAGTGLEHVRRRPFGALTGMVSLDLAVNAIVAGLLLGGFYAAVTIGVTISFGMLDIVNADCETGCIAVFGHPDED